MDIQAPLKVHEFFKSKSFPLIDEFYTSDLFILKNE